MTLFDRMQTEHSWYSCCALVSTHFRSDLWCHFCTSDNPV